VNVLPRRRRMAAALAVAAAILPLAATATAGAAPARTATTTKYTRAVYLQHALGLPASNPNPVIESVTYDRFQHLLRQPGNFAILIGDPATDDTFAARAREVEAAASAASVQRVYWFNPNLSGGAKIGTVNAPNLDIRNADGITVLTSNSRNKYKDAWGNLLAQSLGNGITATRSNPGAQTQSVTTAAGANVNDAGTPLYDYVGGVAPANVTDSYFLVYNTDNTSAGANDKIVSWVNLTKDADAAAKVAAAIAGTTFARVDQFAWWKDEANERARVAANNIPTRGPDVPVVTDADNAAADGGWRVNQITFPELIDLLQNATDGDAAILLGGTWCPNTRAVLPFVNKEAQKNDVTVFNYDTVLDGGKVGGNPTGGANPLQTRNAHGNGAFPSFLYGELVSQYLSNFKTEYQTNNAITYFPGGDTTKPAITTRRLQVPYLFAFKGQSGDAPHGGVTRQWIIDKGNGAYTEYMTNWWLTNPQPDQIGLSQVQLPQGAAAWQKINAQLPSFSWKTDLATVLPNRAVYTDSGEYLIDSDTATVTPTATGATVALGGANPIPINPTALSGALAALGAAAPVDVAAARAAHVAERAKPAPDQAVLGHLATIIGAWVTADLRKGSVSDAWGSAIIPSSVAGGAAAKHALDVFFGGLPGGVVSTRTVTANPVVYGTAPTINLTIANEYGRTPAGNVSLVVKQGATTVATASTAVSNDAASFTLPVLGAGTYEYTLSYAGDDQLAAFTETGSLTVSPAAVVDPPGTGPVVIKAPGPQPPAKAILIKASKVKGAVSKAPTSKKAGKYKVTITTPKGAAAPSGKVTLKLKKGKTTKTVTGKLSKGTVTFSVPKLAKGTWKVTIAWPGDSKYQAASATGASIKVKK
jgi:hypothetical protein